ncbi:MAG: hypothetical protein ACK5BN_03465 [Planctomycetota bacterium]
MPRISSLSRAAFAAAACAFSLSAQCLDANVGVGVGTGDEIVLPGQTLPFPFPFNGATYTTIHPSTNGFVYLSNGTTTGGALCCDGTTPLLTTAVSPMIAACWTDLNMVSGTGEVKFFANAAKANITWENAIEYGTPTATGQFTAQLQLYPTGEFDVVLDSRVAVRNVHTFLVGMSPGAGAVAGAAANFGVANTGATNTNYQTFGPTNGPIGLAGKGVHFVPTNPGFVWVPTNCSASHTAYGTGCYNVPASAGYEFFANAPAAQAALQGNALTLIPAGASYVTTWLPGVASSLYVPPTAAAVSLPVSDDGDDPFTPSAPFPLPGGVASQFRISHNGLVTVGNVANNDFDYTPTGAELASQTQTAFYLGWHDWADFDAAGTGRIKTEEIGSVIYITWDNVENYPTGVANPGTMQIQFDRSSGIVTYVWTVIDPSTASTFGTAYVVGFRGAGTTTDPGSTTLSAATQTWVVTPTIPLALAASPNPNSTATTGTTVVYTPSNIPEFVTGSGLYVAVNILSLNPVPAPGFDLEPLGAPGCAAFVGTLSLTQSMVGTSNSQTVTLALPPGGPAGPLLDSHSASLNGLNAFGITTSNGIESFVQPQ